MGTAIGDDFKLYNRNGKGNRQNWVVLESLFKNRAGSRRSSRLKAQVYMCVYYVPHQVPEIEGRIVSSPS